MGLKLACSNINGCEIENFLKDWILDTHSLVGAFRY